jgi:hypothetical protein
VIKKVKKSSATTKKSKPQKTIHPLFKVGIAIIVLLIGAGLVYSTMLFKNSDYEQQGFITCNEDNTVCEESKHIHAEIEVSYCGEQIQFPKENGDTGKQHTHKERNKIHWHARIPIEPETKIYIDSTPRKLVSFFEQMGMTPPFSCPTNPNPDVEVIVNNNVQLEGLDYVWQEGDNIHVTIK